MSRYFVFAVTLSVALFLLDSTNRADEKEKAVKAKCPVSGKDINKEASVDYKGGKVYFCCPGCPGAFAKNTEKYAAKANHQLVLTGQAKQLEKCPLTGKPLNPEQTVKVAGVKVTLCCGGCKAKVTKAKGEEKLNLVFNDKAFEKGFKVKKSEEK